MTCREVADFILDYLNGELPATIVGQFDHHMGLCENCRRYLANYQTAIDLGRRVFEDEDAAASEAGVPEELVKAILASRK